MLLAFLLPASIVFARHQCPVVQSPPGMWGLTTAPSSLPTGTFLAIARSSETSGCDRGHPSSNFYEPQVQRINQFMQESMPWVREESSQGVGPHLFALAKIAGCDASASLSFQQMLHENHDRIFPESGTSPLAATRSIVILLTNDPALKSCESG